MNLRNLEVRLPGDTTFSELIGRVRERMAELDETGWQLSREELFDTSGLQRSFVPTWYNPDRQNILQEYMGRAERLEIANMIREAEEQIWCANHEREGTDERSNESDGTRRGPADRVGHGGPGDGGGCPDDLRPAAFVWARGVRDQRHDAETGGVRPDGGADRDDDAYGRRIRELQPVGYWGGRADLIRFAGDGCAPIIMRDADDRAEALLLEHLDEQQANTWQGAGFFDVTVPSGNRYRVERDGSQQVRNLDDRTAYCFQPVGTVPRADTALAHKLWLEADEAGFLKAANKFPARTDAREFVMCHGRRDVEIERHLLDAQEDHQQRLETLHRDFQERLVDEEYRYREQVERIQQEYQNCRCALDPNRGLYLRTLEEARAFMEGQNWDVELTIGRGDYPPIYGCDDDSRWVRALRHETVYEVNDMPSDAHTVDLLRQVAMERNERHAAAFEAGVETERNRATFTQQELDYLSNLDCPMEVQVREGCCDAQP